MSMIPQLAGSAYLVIWIIIIVLILKKSGKIGKNRAVRPPRIRSSAQPAKETFKTVGKREPGHVKESLAFMEDRKHDWLARQLREEQRIYMKNDIFGPSAGGKDGSARALKMMHILEHDDSIDDGEDQ